MNPSVIKYIGYYTDSSVTPSRSVPLAGRNKMNYTIGVLTRLFDRVEIISPACVKRGEPGCGGSVTSLGGKVRLKLFSMFGSRNRLTASLNCRLVKLKLLLYLLSHTRKDEPVLVYHSLVISDIILLAKKLRKFKLILELNEIYSDVPGIMEGRRKDELKIIGKADAFLFPNDQMNGMFNPEDKPFAVEYGIYTPGVRMAEKFDDGKIHVVYAGTFDPAKGGVAAALAAAACLPENYHVHILGFGSDTQTDEIRRTVERINALGKCSVSYDGMLDGEEFIKFLQRCHIGLSTQNPDAAFNATSFPSKILTYLANGLEVVSIDIPAISDSRLSDDITFYRTQTPEAIAAAIMEVDTFEPHDALLKRLDTALTTDIRHLYESI